MIRSTVLLAVFFALTNYGSFATFSIGNPSYVEDELRNFASDMTVSYTVSGYTNSDSVEIFPDAVDVTLFPRNCPSGESLNSIGGVIEISSENFADSTFSYNISVNPSLVNDASDLVTFSENNLGPTSIGNVTFCTLVTTRLDSIASTSISALFTNWIVSFNMTGGTISFNNENNIQVSSGTIDDENIDVAAPATLTACACSGSELCTAPTPLEMNSNLVICLITPDQFRISNFIFNLTVGDFTYTPVTMGTDGLPNITSSDLTTVQVNDVNYLVVTTFAVGSLYEQGESVLTVSGSAILEFASSRRTDEVQTFQTLVPLKKEKECGFGKIKKKLKSLWE